MESVPTLLGEALDLCQTKRALASKIGTTEANLQGVIKGERHLTPQQCAALAALLNVDPKDVLALDAVAREKDEAKRAALRAAFFRRIILGAAVLIGGFGGPSDSRAEGVHLVEFDKVYIVAAFAWLTRWARRCLRIDWAPSLARHAL